MLEMLKFDTSCVFSSFDRTRCKIYDILCNVIFHVARINEHEQIHEYFHRDRNIFFNFYLKLRCVYTKEELKEIDFIPSKRFLVEKKKIAALYIPHKLSFKSRIFGIRWISLAKSNVQIFYITNFVWNDAIRGDDA